MDDLVDAVGWGFETCVGYSGSFPRLRGNCFDLRTADKQYFKILNFHAENLEYALQHGLIDWPIKIRPMEHRCAVIHDCRIPHDWYMQEFCTICTPDDLLPLPQKLARERDIETGALIYWGAEGMDGRMCSHYWQKRPKWVVEE
jgi:hypothetical protein